MLMDPIAQHGPNPWGRRGRTTARPWSINTEDNN